MMPSRQVQPNAAKLLWGVLVVMSVMLHLIYLQAHLGSLPDTTAPLTQLGLTLPLAQGLTFFFEVLWAFSFYSVSLYLVVKRPHSPMVWLVSAAGFMVPVRVAFMQVLPLNYLPEGFPPIGQTIFLAIFATLTYAVFAVFPDGRFVPSWTRWWVLLRVPIMVNYMIDVIPALNRVYVWVDILMFGALALAQYRRFRTGRTPIQRQQTKWVLLGMSVGLAFFFVKRLADVYNPGAEWYLVAFVLSRIAVFSIPLAISFALLRYRLYDVDWVLNRSIVYGLLTAFLGTVFAFGVGLVQVGISSVADEQVARLLAAAASALAVALLFEPTRRRLQAFVDHRFFRLRLTFDQLQARQRETRHMDEEWSGLQLGNVKVGELVGKGGMARVYTATDEGRRVAVKLLPRELADHKTYRRLFLREMTLFEQLHHPNVCQMFGAGIQDGIPYIVMEYLEGEELGQHLKRDGVMSLEQTRLILHDVAQALDYVHEMAIVHRDIKPGNVILQDMRAVLTDFGLAKQVSEGMDGASGVIGTLEYLAPEQISEDGILSKSLDIYSLGILAYKMLTGETPFQGSLGQVVFGHLNQPPPDPRTLNPSLPETTALAILKALEKEPTMRYGSATEFAKAL